MLKRKNQLIRNIPCIRFNSEYFKCNRCGYAEPRLVRGNVSHTPCPECGYSPLYRVK